MELCVENILDKEPLALKAVKEAVEADIRAGTNWRGNYDGRCDVSGRLERYLDYLGHRIAYLRGEALDNYGDYRTDQNADGSNPSYEDRRRVDSIISEFGSRQETLEELRRECLRYLPEGKLKSIEEYCDVRGLSKMQIRNANDSAVWEVHKYLRNYRDIRYEQASKIRLPQNRFPLKRAEKDGALWQLVGAIASLIKGGEAKTRKSAKR